MSCTNRVDTIVNNLPCTFDDMKAILVKLKQIHKTIQDDTAQ